MSSAVQRQQALAFIAAVDDWNTDAVADLLHKDFTHQFLPASLDGFGKPVRTKQEFLDHVVALRPAFQRLGFLPPKEIIEGENFIMLHLVTNGKTASGKAYNNEYMFNFRFEGDKILSIKEFMDSKYVTKMLEGEAQPA